MSDLDNAVQRLTNYGDLFRPELIPVLLALADLNDDWAHGRSNCSSLTELGDSLAGLRAGLVPPVILSLEDGTDLQHHQQAEILLHMGEVSEIHIHWPDGSHVVWPIYKRRG